MVTTERAQLVLAGSIAVALVLISMTLVLNSVVYTENIAGGSSVEVTGDVNEFDREARRNTAGLTIRTNHGTKYDSQSAVRDDLSSHFANYSRILTESYADTGSVYVNVTYEDTTEFGSRIVQSEDANFSRDDGTPQWTPFDSDNDLGWFVANFEIENVSESTPFVVEFTNSTGSTLRLEFEKSPTNELEVTSILDGNTESDVECTPSRGRVLLNVVDGESYNGDCEFESLGLLDPPYSQLRFDNGESARGKYDFVVDNSSDIHPFIGSCSSEPANRPCEALAAWTVEVTIQYETNDISYEATREIEVYHL